MPYLRLLFLSGAILSLFKKGFKAMLPVIVGVVPFGIVMGTVAAHAELNFSQSFLMNIFVFAGASQLAAVDLMTKHTESVVVIATGLTINLRFLLYSAALSPILQRASLLKKLVCAYCLTDQNYTVMIGNQKHLHTHADSLRFYFGASLCMFLAWNISVALGFVFGNVAPASWSLEYAVPLSFVALVMPTMKDRRYIYVAVFSSVASLCLSSMPFRLGLLLSSFLGIGLAIGLSRRRVVK
jgi:predicted branched-subunit amino acid permease